MTKIIVIIGSLRTYSINKILAKNLESLAPMGTEFVYANINLPLFNQDLESNFPAEVINFKNQIESSDGVLIVTPEYNRSFPGVLKNAIDWASRPFGRNSFQGKPTGIIGASQSQTGTAQAQAQLRNVMIYLNTKLLCQPELYISTSQTFDENGQVLDTSKEFLQKYIDALITHINN
jgi:chromate reductase